MVMPKDLPFSDDSIDIVTSFGVLHHIKDHKKAVAEMCRVAKRAVFISDHNDLARGTKLSCTIKQGLHALRLWHAFDLIRTRGKGYHYSEDDGIFYDYFIFDDVPVLRRKFSGLHFMSTLPSGVNLYRDSISRCRVCPVS